eukprot:Gb_41822 [translate_table: standard]
MRLEGEIAIITGGASGIGKETVKLFVENGAKVIIADIQDELGRSVADSFGPQVSYFHCDVSKEDQVSALVDYTLDKYGKLDIMFNNAGAAGKKTSTVATVTIEDIQSAMSVNVVGSYLCTKHAARAMIPKNKGCILYTASLASVMVVSNTSAAYPASKQAIVGIMKAAASNLAPYGIRANCLSPTAMPTPMFVQTMKKVVRTFDAETVGELMEIVGELKGQTLWNSLPSKRCFKE